MFFQVTEDMFGATRDSVGEDATLTVVFDKGMNSENNTAAIDGREGKADNPLLAWRTRGEYRGRERTIH